MSQQQHKHVWIIIEHSIYFRKVRCEECGLSRQWYDSKEWKDLK